MDLFSETRLSCFHSRFSQRLIKSNLVFLTNPFLPPLNSNFCSSENSVLVPCHAASRLSKRLTTIPRCRRGEWLCHGGDVCGLICWWWTVLSVLFLLQESNGAGVFCSCQNLIAVKLLFLFVMRQICNFLFWIFSLPVQILIGVLGTQYWFLQWLGFIFVPKTLVLFGRGQLKLPLKKMISDFETACLHQKIGFRDGEKQFGSTGSLCIKVYLVSQFHVRIDFSEKEFN